MNEVSESIMRGLQEMLEHAQGNVELKSRYVEAVPPKQYTADEIRQIRGNPHVKPRKVFLE